MVATKKEAAKPAAKPAPAALTRDDGPFGRRTYWFTFLVSLVALVVFIIYYQGVSQLWIKLLYWISEALAIGLLAWSLFALLRNYRVIERIGASAERIRESRETAEGAADEEVVYRENVVVRGFKFIGRLFMLLLFFVWNTVLRIVYIIERTILGALILAYDIIYYVLYAAWSIGFYAWKISSKIAFWALRVSWKILRILTKLPLAKGLWVNKMRPTIVGRWHRRVDHINLRKAAYIDRRRRLAAARGMDPDKWYKDWQLRHHFLLSHPHEARKGLRERIDHRRKLDYNRRDRWRAYRKGLPIPPKLQIDRPGREKKESRGDKRLRKLEAKKEKNVPSAQGKKPRKGGLEPDAKAAPE